MTDRLKLRTKPLRKLGAVDLNETTEYLAMASGTVSNSIDLRKVVAIQQILHNKTTCIFDQLAGPYGSPSVLACGDVAENAGKALFGKVWVTPYLSYHQPLPYQAAKLDWDDLKYTEAVTKKAVAAIKSHLDNGTAPRVGFVHHVTPGMVAKNGALQPTLTGGHFGLIVAYSEDRFLYLDPYPQASKTTYAGGLPFNKGKVCSYLGVLHLSTTRGLHMETIAETSSPGILGEMGVIAGPL